MRLIVVMLVLMAGAVIANPSVARELITVDKFVDYFDRIAFRSEYKTSASPHFLRKWPGKTIRFKIGSLKKPAEKYRPLIARYSKSLARFGAPKFAEIGGQTPSEDLVFMFVRTKDMSKTGRLLEKNEEVLRNMARGRCYFLSYFMPGGKLVKGMIVVNAELPDVNIRHCLLEEMAQSLGLPNDSRMVSPSLFNDREQRLTLSLVDKVLVRTLYDKKMKAGMPRKLALETARQIISRLMAKVRKN